MARRISNTDGIVPRGGLDEFTPDQDVSPDKWTECENVEPMPDGVRRRRGHIPENSVAIGKIALAFDDIVRAYEELELTDGSSEYVAQSFTANSDTLNINHLAVRLRIYSGSPTGTITAALWGDSGGAPDLSSAPALGVAANWSSVEAGNLTNEYKWYQFQHQSTGAVLVDGTDYWIVIFHSDADTDGTNIVSCGYRATGGGVSSRAPDDLVVDPVIWFIADDITGVADTNDTGTTVLPEHTGNFVGWQDTEATGTFGVTMHTADGADPVNGHAWVAMNGTADLALSGTGSVSSLAQFSSQFSVACVYKPSVNDDHTGWVMGRKKSKTLASGIGMPYLHASGVPVAIAIENTVYFTDAGSPTNSSTDPYVMIIRRDGADLVTSYGSRDGGDPVSFGSVTASGLVEMDALFRADNNAYANTPFGLCEFIAYDGYISTPDRNALYSYLAEKYGLDTFTDTVETDPAVSGNVATSTDGSSWVADSEADMAYRLYSGTAPIRAIIDYNMSDQQGKRHIIVADQEVYKNTGGRIELVSGRIQQPLGFTDDNSLCDWAIGNDTIYMTGNDDSYTPLEEQTSDPDGFTRFILWSNYARYKSKQKRSMKFYIHDGEEIFDYEGITPPGSKIMWPDVRYHPDGLTEEGEYAIEAAFYNANTGQISNTNFLGTSQTLGDTGTGNRQNNWFSLGPVWNAVEVEAGEVIVISGQIAPANPQSTFHPQIPPPGYEWGKTYTSGTDGLNYGGRSWGYHERITEVRFYIKTPSSSVFRYVKSALPGQNFFYIGQKDLPATTQAEYNHNVPPYHKCKCIAENRQFIGNITEYNGARFASRVMFSLISGITPYYESFPSRNYRDFGVNDADYITGLFFVPPRWLVVGMRSSIWAIDARNPKTSERVNVSRTVGIASPRAASEINGRLFLLSNSPSQPGHFVWEPGRGEPQKMRGVEETLKTANRERMEYASSVVYSPDDERSQWWTFISDRPSNINDLILVYDWELNAWAVYTKAVGDGGTVIGIVEDHGRNRIYLGGEEGIEHRMDIGDDDDGTVYTSKFKMRQFDFDDAITTKRFRQLAYVSEGVKAGNMTVNLERDFGDRDDVTATFEQLGSTTGKMVYGTGTWATETYSGPLTKRGKIALRGKGSVFAPEFTYTGQWYLKGVAFGVQSDKRDD